MALNLKWIQFHILTVIIILHLNHQIKCEMYTSTVHMEKMVKSENVVVNNLKDYIATQRRHLHFLKTQLQEYEKKHLEASADVPSYLANPINAYLITKRLTGDFQDIQYVMESGYGINTIQNITSYQDFFGSPTNDDLRGTALGLLRVQKIYKISVTSIANGLFSENIDYRYGMSSDDCFVLGKYAAETLDYEYATIWYREALERLFDEESERKADILRRLINSTHEQAKYVDALHYTDELLKLKPGDKHLMKYQSYITKHFNVMPSKTDELNESTEAKKSSFIEPIFIHDYYTKEQEEQYIKLCRKEVLPTAKQLAPLRCRYISNNSPFLKIAPLKMEEVHLNPDIVLFHDVMYEKEMKALKYIAKKRIKPAEMYDYATGKFVTSDARTSKSVFLPDRKHRYIAGISKRVQDMTGLKTTTAEELQVVNYGIGGHYEPHIDFFDNDNIDRDGNRIATVLFYMSDVEQGGATVFPFLNIAIWPEKGAAAFWYNLYKSGYGDFRTKHAACPILVGTKWVANKWLRAHEQEFSRPCGLIKDHPKYQEQVMSKTTIDNGINWNTEENHLNVKED